MPGGSASAIESTVRTAIRYKQKMRILLTSHFPLARLGSGSFVRDLGRGLADAGNQVQCLCTGTQLTSGEPLPVETLICSSTNQRADLPFDLPDFLHPGTGKLTFSRLTDDQISQYRDVFRRRLDLLVDGFNPDVIHGQHIGLQGELILETGVPYVLTAHWSELVTFNEDSRIRSLAVQAAENAGRIFVGSEWLRDRWRETLDEPADHFQVIPNAINLIEPPETDSFPDEPIGKPIPGQARKVLYIADPTSDGGIELFLNALARLASSGELLSIRIVGDPSQHELLKFQAARLGITGIQFSERSGDEDLPHIQEADLVVFEYAGEVSEAVAVQALSTGSVVVCVTTEPYEYPRADVCSLDVRGGDHELLADTFARALQTDAVQHYSRTQQILGRHSLDATLPKVLSTYESVLHQRFGRK